MKRLRMCCTVRSCRILFSWSQAPRGPAYSQPSVHRRLTSSSAWASTSGGRTSAALQNSWVGNARIHAYIRRQRVQQLQSLGEHLGRAHIGLADAGSFADKQEQLVECCQAYM